MVTILIMVSVVLLSISGGLWVAMRNSQKRLQQRDEEVASLREQHSADQLTIRTLEVQAESRKEREEELRAYEKQMNDHFKNLSTEIFKEQSRSFKEVNRESLDLLLKPFKDNITAFRERVETIYTFENEQRGALKNELERLMELNRRITSETHNLTNALKGSAKTQGDWGEMILETILESSNLVRGTHYTTQQNFKDEQGNNLRPDIVLNLPEGKQIVIDSKTSLTAFVNYTAAEEPEERKRLMEAHIISVRQHIKELSAKDYQRFINSPDFVIMFIPSEPAFLAALQSDNTLWSEAYERRVIISSPTNLFALLKLVDDLWKRNAQSKNTAEIVTRGVKLYEQLVNFVGSLEGVGTALSKAQTSYDDAYKRLTSGNDNIIRSGEKLRQLGLPTKKRQSTKALTESETEEVEEVEEREKREEIS